MRIGVLADSLHYRFQGLAQKLLDFVLVYLFLGGGLVGRRGRAIFAYLVGSVELGEIAVKLSTRYP